MNEPTRETREGDVPPITAVTTDEALYERIDSGDGLEWWRHNRVYGEGTGDHRSRVLDYGGLELHAALDALAAIQSVPVAPPQGTSYAMAVRQMVRVAETFGAPSGLEINTIRSYAPALRALAELVTEAEKAQADLAANVSTQGDDAVYEYEMACHALTVQLAAGFHLPSGAVGK